MSRGRRRKQISLAVFDNEPTARMAEQRLQLEDIPCFIRSLRGGPGLWGSAYNLPHDLLVYEEDQMRAREVLDIAPREIIERERQGQQPPAPTAQGSMPQWMVTGAIVIIVAFIALAVVMADRAVR